ncbi:MAG TPA: malto-oligosyltrehalose synthase [Terriglobales bacterium]|nr:malto-oligosyltrehalose synthase [Terriglobales bacterium]
MKPHTRIPLSTYRLQLNREFTFTQAAAIVPYLAGLGISHCYISPCLKARSGSMHGYDIVDHSSFNPDIGTAEDFDRFVAALHDHGMGLVLDIVPNHMGVMGSDNAWWLDILENGQASMYAGFFDIDWDPPNDDLKEKVLVPALHDHYGTVLESGELQILFRDGAFLLAYRNHLFPLDPKQYARILGRCAESLAAKLGEQNTDFLEFQSLITAFSHLPSRHEISNDRVTERNRDKEIHKRRLAELCARATEISLCVDASVRTINGDPADPSSFEDLHELIKAQAFRLANWRVAADDINYRRFFDTNDLAGICVENEAVFEACHRLVLRLVADGKVDGFRIDHPDGLYDPAQYFERLKGSIDAVSAPDPASRYTVIEKVLIGTEHLPSDWPVCGTTGYDFANLVNGLFVDPAAVTRVERIYRHFLGEVIDLDDLAYRCRKLIIQVALASEVNVLGNQLARIALSKRRTCDFTLNSLREALTEVAANFPVYRTYVNTSGVLDRDVQYIRRAVAAAKLRSQTEDVSILDFVENVLVTRIAQGQDPAYRSAVTAFAMKFQQFTSPVMAKGIEDTAFYRYNRLVSLNEVGSDLQRFGITAEEFHRANQERARDWPHTMLATSTHDSKRSEDVRTRINALSEMPAEWRFRLRDWKRINRHHKSIVNGRLAPFPNDEYLLYQTLVGAWPFEDLREEGDWERFRNRIEQYMLKAIREAKRNTSWINRNAEYEAAVSSFVRGLLTPNPKNRFLADFAPFQHRIARIGMWNSLSQTLLKLACPGVPDIYQGNDLWDFSLVDPDNRRPVDYGQRGQMFESIRRSSQDAEALMARLLETPEDGRVKLYLIWRALCLRRQQPALFQQGEYQPLEVVGAKANHVVAFARSSADKTAVIVVPHLIVGLLNGADVVPVGDEVWFDTRLVVPNGKSSRRYRNIFTTGVVQTEDKAIEISKILTQFPAALLVAE